MRINKKECVAMLLAGGQGSRLFALTNKIAKPAVPFGGKYRIIDFPLSNCVNSGIDTVGVMTQYQPLILNEYIGNGEGFGPFLRRRTYTFAVSGKNGLGMVQRHGKRNISEHFVYQAL